MNCVNCVYCEEISAKKKLKKNSQTGVCRSIWSRIVFLRLFFNDLFSMVQDESRSIFFN